MWKVIYSKHLPLGREMNAMAVWPFIIVKKSRAKYFTARVERHERIHLAQQEELLPVAVVLAAVLVAAGSGWWSLLALPLYFWLYAILFVWKFLGCWNWLMAYQRNPLEMEAYSYECHVFYLGHRKHFAWFGFL